MLTRIEKKPRFFAWALCFAFLIFRAWPRVTTPDLVVEDGFLFFRDVLETGVSTFFTPYAGSFFSLQRLIMSFAFYGLLFSLIPMSVCLLCLLLTSFITSKVVTREFEWLIPKFWVRMVLAILLCSVPGIEEMAGSLAHINWFLVLWLGLLGLQDPETRFTQRQVFGVLLVAYSVGMTLLLLPLFGWRVWKSRFEKQEVLVFGILLLSVLHLVLIRNPNWSAPLEVSWAALNQFLGSFIRTFGFQPWLGNQNTAETGGSPIRWVGELSVYAATVGLFYRNRKESFAIPLVCFVIGICAWIPLNWISRPNSFKALLWNDIENFLRTHHAFPIGMVAVVFWVVTLSRICMRNGRAPLLYIFFVLYFVFLIPRFSIPPYGKEPYWPLYWNELKNSYETGCPVRVLVQVQPGTFHHFYYTSPKGCLF